MMARSQYTYRKSYNQFANSFFYKYVCDHQFEHQVKVAI